MKSKENLQFYLSPGGNAFQKYLHFNQSDWLFGLILFGVGTSIIVWYPEFAWFGILLAFIPYVPGILNVINPPQDYFMEEMTERDEFVEFSRGYAKEVKSTIGEEAVALDLAVLKTALDLNEPAVALSVMRYMIFKAYILDEELLELEEEASEEVDGSQETE